MITAVAHRAISWLGTSDGSMAFANGFNSVFSYPMIEAGQALTNLTTFGGKDWDNIHYNGSANDVKVLTVYAATSYAGVKTAQATSALLTNVSTTAARGAAQLTGQMHHGISRTVHKALEAHPNLKGLYSARDSRFVTQAKDLASHNGYDKFHRNLDAEVAGWVRANPSATQAQFETYLRGVYQRADVLEHFPNGL